MATAHAEPTLTGASVADRLLEAGRDMARSQHRLVVLAAEFEETTEWYVSGATPAHWMAQQLDVCVATAREWIRMGRALRNLPVVEEAFASQHLSFAKVRALTRLAQPDTEVELVEPARAVPAGRLGHALAPWTQRREDHRERAAPHERERSLRHRVEPDGMVTFTVRLAPKDAAATLAAIEASMMRRSLEARSPNVTESDTEGGNYAAAVASASLAQQRADAFVELITAEGRPITRRPDVDTRRCARSG